MGQPLRAPKAALCFRVPRRLPRRPSVGSAFSEDLPLGVEPRSHGATEPRRPSLLPGVSFWRKQPSLRKEGSHAGKCGPAWVGNSSDLPLPALSSLKGPFLCLWVGRPCPTRAWDGSPRFAWAAQAAHGPWGRSLGTRTRRWGPSLRSLAVSGGEGSGSADPAPSCRPSRFRPESQA